MAWYCPTLTSKINKGDAAVFITNVKPSTCPKPCIDKLLTDKYSKCYQDKALKAHNVKRALHKVPALTLDIDTAKRAQLYAANLANGITPTVPTTEKCGVNTWNADTVVNAKN